MSPGTPRILCTVPLLFSPLSLDVTRLPAEIAEQTLDFSSQCLLARQVGTWGGEGTEEILFCGFRLHKHHYHLRDLELPCRSAATPILSGNLEWWCAQSPRAHGEIESTKRIFERVCGTSPCLSCVSAGGCACMYVRWLRNLSRLLLGTVSISLQSFLTMPLPVLDGVEH